MIDFKHIINQPNADIQVFVGDKTRSSYTHYETWEKPKGAKWIYMMAVGAGGSGAGGANIYAGSGPGAGGGGSGGQTTVFYPAFFVPDLLFVDVGLGGASAALVSGASGNAGTSTDIRAETGTSGSTSAQMSFCQASGGNAGQPISSQTVGGTGGTGGSALSVGNMVPAGRGIYSFLAGQAGTDGGTNLTHAPNQLYPATGLCVTGGTGGGGGGNTTAYNGGGFIGPGANNAPDFAPYGNSLYMPGILPATPAVNGQAGWNQLNNIFSSGQGFIMNRGGQGGGGSGTAGNAGTGGNGAPGCGGGGVGGMTTTKNTLALSGTGGPGFAIIISF